MYVLAVSGGVDSMVLLHLAAKLYNNKKQKSKYKFIVAHFDHGMRDDSDEDRKLVEFIAKGHGLIFVYDASKLGPDASEAEARRARYDFLKRVRSASGADAIVTAHHEDDLVETAIMNLLRGTGRKGLSSLANKAELRRPLLSYSKKQLYTYAKQHKLMWREDSTNQDTKYRRNYIRKNIVAKMDEAERKKLLDVLSDAKRVNFELDERVAKLLQFLSIEKNVLDRKIFIGLPHKIALEVMAAWLRVHKIRQFDSRLLESLVLAAKTSLAGKKADINNKYYLEINRDKLQIITR